MDKKKVNNSYWSSKDSFSIYEVAKLLCKEEPIIYSNDRDTIIELYCGKKSTRFLVSCGTLINDLLQGKISGGNIELKQIEESKDFKFDIGDQSDFILPFNDTIFFSNRNILRDVNIFESTINKNSLACWAFYSGERPEFLQREIEVFEKTRPQQLIEDRKSGKLGETNLFIKEGEYWTILYRDEKPLRLKHSRGLIYIAYLLSHPNKPFDIMALDSVGRSESPGDLNSDSLLEMKEATLNDVFEESDEIIDKKAKREFREKIRELEEEWQIADDTGNEEKAAKIIEEIDYITQELKKSKTPGGKIKKFSNANVERIRKRVSINISNTLKIIENENVSIYRHLQKSITTGRMCMYVSSYVHRNWITSF